MNEKNLQPELNRPYPPHDVLINPKKIKDFVESQTIKNNEKIKIYLDYISRLVDENINKLLIDKIKDPSEVERKKPNISENIEEATDYLSKLMLGYLNRYKSDNAIKKVNQGVHEIIIYGDKGEVSATVKLSRIVEDDLKHIISDIRDYYVYFTSEDEILSHIWSNLYQRVVKSKEKIDKN